MLPTLSTDPLHVQAETTGGLEGAIRILTMLRIRRYPVASVRVDVDERSGWACVHWSVPLDPRGATLLLARLERMPTVVRSRINPDGGPLWSSSLTDGETRDAPHDDRE